MSYATVGECSGTRIAKLPRAFLPTDVPNVALWLDRRAGVESTAGAVTAWRDYSGNIRDWTQSSGALQPALATDGTLRFSGAQRLEATTAALNVGRNITGLTVVMVVNETIDSQQRAVLQIRQGTGSTSRIQISRTTANVRNLFVTRGDGDSLGTALGVDVATSGWQVVTHIVDYSARLGSRFVNRAARATLSGIVGGGPTSDTAATSASIGSLGGSLFWSGALAAMLVVHRAVTTAERKNLETYAAGASPLPIVLT